MHSLPSGTVTFLFTDIEGSTKLWERYPAQMAAALARHDALLREAIARRDGAVFATGGDSFCAAFATPATAVDAALQAQVALAMEPWPESARLKVRMALHTGAAELRDNDYFGPPLNRVARLLSAGHGGQVLLSLATQELVRDDLPAGAALRDMGERHLKDLIRPERVYQLLAPDLAADFPPLKTLDARAHNLPIQSTSFVGREREMQEIKALLIDGRLTTLTGAGGTGKTRLALQVSADLVDEFADGVWFVQLAALSDASLVPQAVAMTVGIKEQPQESLIDTLTREIRGQQLLLVLDNCEHLLPACALLCDALLSACAGVRMLATSREALRVSGEAVYRVPPLAAPDTNVPAHLESLTQFAAVRLFIDRALTVKSTFRVDNANAPAVASICRHLDGIPLAIELAASRVRSMTVEEVNERLDQRFRLLTGGSRMALARQQTLRALFDWSYDLLTPAEGALFRRLSVLAGGWTLRAAERICSDANRGDSTSIGDADWVDEEGVLDLLTSLVDKSLVSAEQSNGATRYQFLETVRQYACDRLLETGEEATLRSRHLVYWVALAEEAETHFRAADQQEWQDKLETEHDNVRSALRWSATGASGAVLGLRLAGALARFWSVRGYLSEGRDVLMTLLAAGTADHDSAPRAKALGAAGLFAQQQGDYSAARVSYEAGLAMQRRLGDRAGIASLLHGLGCVAREQGDYVTTRAFFAESLAIYRNLGDRHRVANSLGALGIVARDQGDSATARALLVECIATQRELGDRLGIANSLSNLALVALDQSELDVARANFEEGVAIQRDLDARLELAASLNGLGKVAYFAGDHLAARSHFDESLAIRRELGDAQGIAETLANIGTVVREQGDHAAARAMYEESLAIRQNLGERWGIVEALENLAELESALGSPARAARIWGGTFRLREEIGCPLPPSERADYDKLVSNARGAMGNDAEFDAAWQEGSTMTMAQVIEHASAR